MVFNRLRSLTPARQHAQNRGIERLVNPPEKLAFGLGEMRYQVVPAPHGKNRDGLAKALLAVFTGQEEAEGNEIVALPQASDTGAEASLAAPAPDPVDGALRVPPVGAPGNSRLHPRPPRFSSGSLWLSRS